MIVYSDIEPVYYLLPIIGFIVGLFGTMLGGGGGFIFLPVLSILIGVPMQTAVITSLVATLPIAIVGTVGHSRKSNIDFRTGFMFAVAGIIGAFIGAGITSLVSPDQLRISFGVYSVLIAVHIAYGTVRKDGSNGQKQEEGQHLDLKKKAKGSFFGLFAGIITGTFGTSGTAPVIAGLFSMEIPLKLVIGTSLLVILANTVFAIGAHFLVGQIDFTLVMFLTGGSVIGSLLGPNLLSKMKTDKSENKARYIYAAVMVLIGVLMIAGLKK
ncbi:sulfite exporter TauE/SafE family protein [Maribellus sp. YY47]|uniref:sulfite exporter TauE/SafE family protein n=1 Tax=Maribellus sp. YY47 TaxID=2929486 RepID=UPI002000CA13|nr:sulfite exporter TauE/SafE family protein [Maribellus sp. YY47]MCK3683142.1 sulfite exporter TauE/SafE family protein [Maribellus sp. YY47]